MQIKFSWETQIKFNWEMQIKYSWKCRWGYFHLFGFEGKELGDVESKSDGEADKDVF